MKHKNILFFGKAGYIDTDDVVNWGQKTIYFSGEKNKKRLNQKFVFIQKRGAGKHENQDKITKSNGKP